MTKVERPFSVMIAEPRKFELPPAVDPIRSVTDQEILFKVSITEAQANEMLASDPLARAYMIQQANEILGR